jgi:hypothetical protein
MVAPGDGPSPQVHSREEEGFYMPDARRTQVFRRVIMSVTLLAFGVYLYRRSVDERFWSQRVSSLSLQTQLGSYYGSQMVAFKCVERISPTLTRSLLYIPANTAVVIDTSLQRTEPSDDPPPFTKTDIGRQPTSSVIQVMAGFVVEKGRTWWTCKWEPLTPGIAMRYGEVQFIQLAENHEKWHLINNMDVHSNQLSEGYFSVPMATSNADDQFHLTFSIKPQSSAVLPIKR